jgi:hypothetical protein
MIPEARPSVKGHPDPDLSKWLNRAPQRNSHGGLHCPCNTLGTVAETNRSELVEGSVRNVLAESWSGLVRTRENG